MNYKLLPRFNYTLPFLFYLKLLKRKYINNTFKKQSSNSKSISFNQARVGLRVLLNSISKKNINVGVQAFTCHTVFQAIHNSGNNIIFVDLTDEFKLDINDLKSKIANIDILIVTHTFGFPDNMDEIKEITRNKIIIEDCSHSFLSKYKTAYTGTIADASIFSTGLAKFPPIGAGGFCLINNKKHFPYVGKEYYKIPEASNFESVKVFFKSVLSSILLKPPLFGLFSYKIIKKLDKRFDVGNKYSFNETKGYKWVDKIFNSSMIYSFEALDKQKQNFEYLSSKINSDYLIKQMPLDYSPNFYIFPLILKGRDNVFNKLLKNNIQSGKHFHKCLDWAHEFGYKIGDCPNTEKISREILTIPIHIGVSKLKLEKIAKLINENQ